MAVQIMMLLKHQVALEHNILKMIGTADLSYKAGSDLAHTGTAFLDIVDNVGNANDEGSSGTLHLFDPSNTTFVKHFLITTCI